MSNENKPYWDFWAHSVPLARQIAINCIRVAGFDIVILKFWQVLDMCMLEIKLVKLIVKYSHETPSTTLALRPRAPGTRLDVYWQGDVCMRYHDNNN